MTNCTQKSFQFPVCNRRRVEANFQGGDITSDGGVLLQEIFPEDSGQARDQAGKKVGVSGRYVSDAVAWVCKFACFPCLVV